MCQKPIRVSPKKVAVQATMCNICKKSTTDEDRRDITCGHIFHIKCLNQKLVKEHVNARCPVLSCKKPISFGEYPDLFDEPENQPFTPESEIKTDPQKRHTPMSKVQAAQFLAQEVGVSLIAGAITRKIWRSYIAKEKSDTKRKIGVALLTIGTIGCCAVLNYTNPERKFRPELTLTCWLTGLCAGMYLSDLWQKKTGKTNQDNS